MVYTIKIRDKSKKARSIINMLKALKEDYDFIEIYESTGTDITKDQAEELDSRYESFLKNKSGKEWEELKKELV